MAMDKPRVIPLEPALMRNVQWLGAEREPAFINSICIGGLLCMANWTAWKCALIFVGFHFILMWTTKLDPQFFKVYFASLKWPNFLAARAGALARAPRVQPSVPLEGIL